MEGDSKIDERLSIIKSQRDAVIKQMEEIQEMLDMLDYKCLYYEIAKESGTCAVPHNMPIESIPEKYHKFINRK